VFFRPLQNRKGTQAADGIESQSDVDVKLDLLIRCAVSGMKTDRLDAFTKPSMKALPDSPKSGFGQRVCQRLAHQFIESVLRKRKRSCSTQLSEPGNISGGQCLNKSEMFGLFKMRN
jgi:hypothetical protein